jgi:hypothetical protein
MGTTTITTSVRNESGSWEIIDREPGVSLDDIEVHAHDIGGEVGEPLLIELRDDEDRVLLSTEIVAR